MTSIMQKLVKEMNDLGKEDNLNFPITKTWNTLPSGWMGFIQEVYIYAFPIKVVINAEDYPFKVYVLEDFRDILKED